MRPRRSADDLAWMRTLAGAVAATLAASVGLVQALEGPGWLKAVAAGVAVGSAILALGLHGVERHAVRRERGPRPPIAALGSLPIARASASRFDLDALPDDAVVVFLSYALEDEQWRHKFETMLRPLCHRGVYVWGDERVVVGESLRLESERAIERAHVALVLVTPDLVACDYIIHEQLPALVERQIPLVFVHVRATLLDDAGALGHVQWGDGSDAPVASTDDPDGAIVRACNRLVELLPAAHAVPAVSMLDRVAARSPRSERLDPGVRLGELHDVPPPAPEEVQRVELDELRAALLREGYDAVGITARRIGLYGQGGIGKTVLAAALARDFELRSYFPEGIYWVTVGARGDLLALQISLLARLAAPSPDPRSIDAGAAQLREALAERRCLLIVDDVWSAAAAAAFAVAGSRIRVLYTTRDSLVLEAVGADVQHIDVLPDGAARTLLARLSGVSVDALPTGACQAR